MKRTLALFLNALLAGMCIALGCTVYLRFVYLFPGSNVIAALLFAVGLFTICTRGYALYTGKVCYLFDNPLRPYLCDLGIIWLGNFCGCALIAFTESFTPLFGESGINAVAGTVVAQKSAASYLGFFLLAILCNIFIYIAVNGYAKNPHQLGKYLALFFGVVCFILAGTEHSIADMYFWCASGFILDAPADAIIRLLLATLGNAVGGVFFPLLERARERLDPA